jgi:2-polyprenyl-6-methoxyphenol hydroxylase-like FAD-dependent oxidoreductase
MTAMDVYSNMSKVGQKVVMVGGGLVGCEVGLHLAKNGRDVTVIEMLGEVARIHTRCIALASSTKWTRC